MQRTLLLILFILPLIGYSQKFNGGVLLGGNVSQVDGDTYEGYHKIGYQAGAYVYLRVSPHSSFQMEMEYFQKGSRRASNPDSGAGDHSYLLRIHYLEIPVLYQYTFAKRFQVEAGPAFDVLLGSLEETDGLPTTNTVALRPVTLSGILGFSCYISHHLKAGFRFNYSLLSIRVPADPEPPGYRHILFETGQYNNVLSLTFSWDFKKFEF
ncbi:MAG: porin family protein [Bacteroidetes bacterium]|nr:porin family protein [Bacteroidota bacterium]